MQADSELETKIKQIKNRKKEQIKHMINTVYQDFYLDLMDLCGYYYRLAKRFRVFRDLEECSRLCSLLYSLSSGTWASNAPITPVLVQE